MTTALQEIVKPAARLTWFLCIEGIGWPTNELDITDGFDGTVFYTTDFTSSLAALLTCTVKSGLDINKWPEDEIDTIKIDNRVGSLEFDLIDYDNTIITTFAPNQITVSEDNLNTALTPSSKTVATVSGTFVENDVVWIAGRECIKLGAKTGAGPYTYSGCTRGYLGTPVGAQDHSRLQPWMMVWGSSRAATTTFKISSVCRTWGGKLVRLYCVPPDGALADILLVWQGEIVRFGADKTGSVFSFESDGTIWGRCTRKRHLNVLYVGSNEYKQVSGFDSETGIGNMSAADAMGGSGAPVGAFKQHFRRFITFDTAKNAADDQNLVGMGDPGSNLAITYNYRPTRYGTGFLSSGKPFDATIKYDETGTQDDAHHNGSIISTLDGSFFIRLIRGDETMFTAVPRTVEAEISAEWAGQFDAYLFAEGAAVAACLDNTSNDYETSRFQINKIVRRNPIDVLLMFILTMPGEFDYVSETTGGSATVVTDSSKAWTVDEWAGYALFCCQHAVNNALCFTTRRISSNTATAITVDGAFPATHSTSHRFQIRNSIYDCLPFGWGLGIPWQRVDIEAFEQMRSDYLSTAELGRFIVGTQHDFDIIEFLTDTILRPYGIILTIDRTTGRIKPVYVGASAGSNGLTRQDMVTVTKASIIDVGKVEYRPMRAKTRGIINVRATEETVVKKTFKRHTIKIKNTWAKLEIDQVLWDGFVQDGEKKKVLPEFIPGLAETVAVEVSVGNDMVVDSIGDNSDDSTLEVDSILHTVGKLGGVDAAVIARIRRLAIPPPYTTIKLSTDVLSNSVYPGSFLKIDFADAPVNPYYNTRGWDDLIARITTIEYNLRDGILNCSLEILGIQINSGMIAPACLADSQSAIAATPAYIGVSDTVAYTFNRIKRGAFGATTYYVPRDWQQFHVGDRIEVRDSDGSRRDGPFIITSFGSNAIADPYGTYGTPRINIDAALAVTIASDDYITFAEWSTSNSTDQDEYLATVTNAGDDLDVNSEAKEWL